MIKTIKKGKQELELSIDWALNTVTYKFNKITGVTMKLTAADILAIQAALKPDFVAVETRVTTNLTNMVTTEIAKVNVKISGLETKLTTKIDSVETKLTTKIDDLSKRIDNIVSKNSLVE